MRRISPAALFAGLLSLYVVAASAGCSWVRFKEPEPEPFVKHVVESQRLRSVMKQLFALLPEDPDAVAPANQDLDEVRAAIANASRDLAGQADRIDKTILRHGLRASRRERLLELSDALRRSAEALAADAMTLDKRDLQTRFDAMIATCNACHAEFRRARGG